MKKILLFAAAAIVAVSASAAEKNVLKTFYDGNGGTLGGWGGNCTFESVEEDGKPCVKVSNPDEMDNDWNCQMAFDYDFEPGVTYYMDFDVKGTVDGTITSGLQNSTTYAGGGNFNPFNITTEWNSQTIKCTATAAGDGLPNRWTANFGKYVGSAWLTNVVLYTLEEGGNDTPVDGDKTLDMLPSLSNEAYDAATKTITFGAAWGWVNWWFGEGDYSEYDSFVLEFEPVSYIVQVMIQYNEGDDLAVQAQPGESKIILPLDAARKNSIKQIAIQNSEPGSLTLTAAYFAASAGVQSISATAANNAVYNLQGVKVANSLDEVAAPGLYISNGKKIIKK
ncbi:MAG: hypothetical protein K2G77_01030 [Muribaculaceae bacterium]|nr:hypothetical protein [Muribaculaceae bacterium]